MITDVVIEDYQSVRKARLALGRFTVVTGPSSSGKSAVVRALRLVAFNAPGTAFVRHGARKCQVAVGFRGETLVVGIERGGRGTDKYRVVRPADLPDDPPQTDTYTKLNKAVPAEVVPLLRLQDINFAGQFDRPFLLSESGSQVARVLGELTNVTLVLDAAREANRRKLEVARELKTWEAVLADMTEQAKTFRTLKDRRQAAAGAAGHLERAQSCTSRRERLGALWSASRTASRALEDAGRQLAVLSAPSAGRLDTLAARLRRLRDLHRQHQEADQAAGEWENLRFAAVTAEAQAHRELHEALVAAGTCPTCGSEMR